MTRTFLYLLVSVRAGLSLLYARCADMALDLSPPFNPNHFVYHAMLDYSCSSAAVDAYPYDEWTITNPEQLLATHLVLPAATVRVDVKLGKRDPDTGKMDSLVYSITISRRDGSETNLLGLDVLDGARYEAAAPSLDLGVVHKVAETVGLTPRFDTALLQYEATLGLGVEFFHVVALPADNGQVETVGDVVHSSFRQTLACARILRMRNSSLNIV
jgi:hypothetical protein